MEHLRAFNMGVNVITNKKDNKFYAMTFAWGMMVDYDKLAILIGSQSDTGENLKIGDKVGISALAVNQSDISNFFGDGHSSEKDKFNLDYLEDYYNIYVVKNAKVKMACEILDVIHLKDIEEDNLVYLKVNNYLEDDYKRFMSLEDDN